jgi:CRISPR-associated protein Csb2
MEERSHTEQPDPARTSQGISGSIFADPRDWILMSMTSNSQLGSPDVLAFAHAARGAFLAAADRHLPAELCGHDDGARGPAHLPHLAFVPLFSPTSREGWPTLGGMAVVPPVRGYTRTMAEVVHAALTRVERLVAGRHGEALLKPMAPHDPVAMTSDFLYGQPARRWATVSPMVFEVFPRGMADEQCAPVVTKACRRAGLPDPIHVTTSVESRFDGMPPSHCFATLTTAGKIASISCEDGRWACHAQGQTLRLKRHVYIEFAHPVPGPMLIGAGAYYGMGLMGRLPD